MPPPPDPLLYSVNTVAEMLGLGETKVRSLVRQGKLRAVRLDGVIRISRESLEQYINSLPGVATEVVDETDDVGVAVPR